MPSQSHWFCCGQGLGNRGRLTLRRGVAPSSMPVPTSRPPDASTMADTAASAAAALTAEGNVPTAQERRGGGAASMQRRQTGSGPGHAVQYAAAHGGAMCVLNRLGTAGRHAAASTHFAGQAPGRPPRPPASRSPSPSCRAHSPQSTAQSGRAHVDIKGHALGVGCACMATETRAGALPTLPSSCASGTAVRLAGGH